MMINVGKIYADRIASPSEEMSVKFPSGRVVLSESQSLGFQEPLNKNIWPGTYNVSIYRIPEEIFESYDASTASGINGLVISFSGEEIASWEEARTLGGDSPVDPDNLIDIVLADKESVEAIGDEIEEVMDDCFTDGFGGCHDDLALVAYIGEAAHEHKFYWGLDAEGHPVKLFGFFVYPEEKSEVSDEDDPSEDASSRKEVFVTLEEKKYSLIIPETLTGKVEVEEYDGDSAEIMVRNHDKSRFFLQSDVLK